MFKQKKEDYEESIYGSRDGGAQDSNEPDTL